MTDNGTEIKTMWSESLLESLYVAMDKQKSDRVVIGIVKDLKTKGYDSRYLIDRVGKKVNPNAGARLRSLLSRGTKAKASVRRKRSKPELGFMDWLMKIFKR